MKTTPRKKQTFQQSSTFAYFVYVAVKLSVLHTRRMLPRVDDVADDLIHAHAVLHLREPPRHCRLNGCRTDAAIRREARCGRRAGRPLDIDELDAAAWPSTWDSRQVHALFARDAAGKWRCDQAASIGGSCLAAWATSGWDRQ